MKVRSLDENGDMRFGRGRRDFYVDQREGVAQKVRTRLGLWTGDWFLDTAAGTPWRTQVFGKRTEATRDPAMRARVLKTSGVTRISSYASQMNRTTRGYAVQIAIDTAYGQAIVSTDIAGPNGDVRNSR